MFGTYYDADLASSVTNGQLLDVGTTVHVEKDGDQYTLLGYYTDSGTFISTPSQQIDASELSNMIHSAGHAQETNVPEESPNAPEPL